MDIYSLGLSPGAQDRKGRVGPLCELPHLTEKFVGARRGG